MNQHLGSRVGQLTFCSVPNAEHEIRGGQYGYAAVAAEQATPMLTAGTTLADEPAAIWVGEHPATRPRAGP